MQVTKANPSRHTSNCILLREKIYYINQLKDHISITKLYNLGHWRHTLCGGEPAALVLTDVKTGDIPLKNSRCIKRFLIKLSKHYDHRPR